MPRKGKRATIVEIVEPTPEQYIRGSFEIENIIDKRNGGASIAIGTAFRRKPMIDVLSHQGVFSDAEHKALSRYRYFADMADRSPLRDSLAGHLPRGPGDGPTAAMLTAVRIKADCERAAGSLQNILRAVVVYDQSLSQWAMEHGGAIEECEKDKKGRLVCRMKPKRKSLIIAKLEIQMAAKRVQSEMDA